MEVKSQNFYLMAMFLILNWNLEKKKNSNPNIRMRKVVETNRYCLSTITLTRCNLLLVISHRDTVNKPILNENYN